jgi:hypothetical protein
MSDTSGANRTGGMAEGGDRSPAIEKGAIEARQGFRGRHVLYVLAISLILALIAYLVLHFYFLGDVL